MRTDPSRRFPSFIKTLKITMTQRDPMIVRQKKGHHHWYHGDWLVAKIGLNHCPLKWVFLATIGHAKSQDNSGVH